MIKMSTMDDFSKNAVESFVQTVVFVDDKIYTPPPDGKILNVNRSTSPKARKPTTKSAKENLKKIPIQPHIEFEDDAPFSPHDIQASFAKKYIVCSLHQPVKTRSVGIESDTYKLCASADIVIIDWDLDGDAGIKATMLIENLILQSLKEAPHQLRLILIYTDSPNLFDIADKVSESLAAKISSNIEYKDADKGLAFHTSNARVVVLGKPAKRLPGCEDFEVNESGLADKAISEFCKLTGGLLQGGILLGLAAIRKQSLKILTKFYSDLDGAFLMHRALGLPHEEAFDHITPLLVSEIEAILEDSLLHPLIANTVIEDWCDTVWMPTTHAKDFVGNTADPRQFAKNLCLKGMDISQDYKTSNTGLGKTIKSLNGNYPRWPSIDQDPFQLLSTYLSKDRGGADLRELSTLMSQRTSYDARRYLAQGTIIREKAGKKRFFICLQPTCDGIRLQKETSFVFCLMTKTDKEKTSHIVRIGNEFDDLLYKPKIADCVTLEFKPSKGKIYATELEFIDTNKQTYQWIAQLKPKHTQQAVEQFTHELSRIGLTESEWLRLKSK